MKRYLDEFDARLKKAGFAGNFFVMLSNGGITTREVASRFPIRVVESGPAAGAIVAAHYGSLMNENKVVSFDMGGTTAKIALIEGGVPRVTTDFEVARVYRFKKGSGLPVKLPVIEMVEIGAGGGSITKIDEIGLLKVGPESAGADPGPVCYDLGGEEPTVTDADLVLGYLNPDYFLGGKMALNLEKAQHAIRKRIADPLGLSLERAAWGIHQVVDENMANAAKVHIVEKGEDPKDYSVIAFGGAGPVHAYWVAEKLGARRIICPPSAGVASAGGFLLVPISFDFVRTFITRLDGFAFDEVRELYQAMEQEGKETMREAGVPEQEIRVVRSCDMRYLGQGHEMTVPIPADLLEKAQLSKIKATFEEQYKRVYHRLNPTLPIQCLNWRLSVSGKRPVVQIRGEHGQAAHSEEAIKGRREVYSPEKDQYVLCPVYDRYGLSPGIKFDGPAIIEETESTIVVGSRGRASVDENFCVVIDV
jgi:N-methylhydantoinase A